MGTNQQHNFNETLRLLHSPANYQKMAYAHNPYGDDQACQRICNAFENM